MNAWFILTGLAGILLGYLALGSGLKALIVIILIIAAASLSTFYYNYLHGPVNFELIKIGTVMSTVAFGIAAGLTVGLASTLLSRVWTGRLDHRTLISMIGIIAVAAGAWLLASQDIRQLGMGLTILYHLITAPLSLSSGDSPAFVVPYVLTNIAFNALLFSTLAPPAIRLIA